MATLPYRRVHSRMGLRSFCDSDLDALYAMDQLCFRTGIAYSKEELSFYAHHPAVLTVIAADDGRDDGPDECKDGGTITGFAMAEISRARKQLSGHVITIDVHPDARRRGLGRQLMAAIEDWLRKRGVAACSLEVAVDDPAALNFYQQLSYKPAGTLRGYYMGTVDAYVLRKMLEP